MTFAEKILKSSGREEKGKNSVVEVADEERKKRHQVMAQNDKYQRRINLGKDLIQEIVSFMIETQELFEGMFMQLLTLD